MELLEITVSGPDLKFTTAAVVSLCGAGMPLTINGQDRPMWSRQTVKAGQTLRIGSIGKEGCRSYLAVKGGFPEM